jgi:rod shape determining protein RodA
MFSVRIDWKLIIPSLLLTVLGLLVIRSAAPALIGNQVLFTIASVLIFLVISFIDFRVFTSLYLPIYFLSLIFLITPYFFGLHSHGAQRWLQFGQFTLQPSEIIKPMMLIVFSEIATSAYQKRNWLLVASAILPLLIIFFQPDLGTTLVLLTGWLTIFLSKLRLKHIVPAVLLFAVLVLPIYQFGLKDYQKQRLNSFFNPYSDPLGQGYHVIQSIIAVGSGQFWGRGLGHGTQSQLQFLPEHHTDFIFASLSEELGFVGSVLVLSLFIILLFRIYRISQEAGSSIASNYCLATVALLAFQIFVNVGMNMGIAPITGITLPFISYGGSSLLSLGITLGLVHSISRNTGSDSFIQIS